MTTKKPVNKNEIVPSKVSAKLDTLIPNLSVLSDQRTNENYSPHCIPRRRISTAQKRAPSKKSESESNELHSTLTTKSQAIESLQHKLSTVQNEMDKLLQENLRLTSNLKQRSSYNQQFLPSMPQHIPSTFENNNFAMIESRLHQYCESTKNFEKQLADMEESVKSMKNELSEVRARRIQSERNPRFNIVPQLKPTCVQHSASGTRSQSNARTSGRPYHCSLKTSSSDQPLLDLKDQYSKLKEDFQLQTQKLVKKIHKNLDSLTR